MSVPDALPAGSDPFRTLGDLGQTREHREGDKAPDHRYRPHGRES
ncbi:hypothetical protein OG625_20210 [Streptomyces sp. NBC_01351]|nr:hypothetical protein [Streptomyces sp. NBC_01351]